MRENGADAEIFVEVIRDAASEQICAGYAIGGERQVRNDLRRNDGIACLHVEQGEIPFADAAIEFDAGVDGNLRAVEKANVAAEEGNELRRVAHKAKAEVILIGAFEEEGTFFGKEKREAGEIDLARVSAIHSLLQPQH